MKTGIKHVVEDIIEGSIASSKIVGVIMGSVKTIAVETKKLAESFLLLKERLDAHEKLLTTLCDIYKHDMEQQQEVSSAYMITRPSKDTSKPN
jgi:hypothetical protein